MSHHPIDKHKSIDRESVGWTLCLTLSDRSASWARRRPRGYVYCAGQVRVAAACTRNRQDTATSRLRRVHRAYREAISRQGNRHVRTHEMPKRPDPFTALAGPGLTMILAIATTVAARYVLARPLMTNRGSP